MKSTYVLGKEVKRTIKWSHLGFSKFLKKLELGLISIEHIIYGLFPTHSLRSLTSLPRWSPLSFRSMAKAPSLS
jgi:hypothetical protein